MFGKILMIISFVICLIGGIKEWWEIDFVEGIKNFIGLVFVTTFISGVIFAIVYGCATDNAMIESEYVGEPTAIQGLQYKTLSDKVTEGSFILGCGGFSSKNKIENIYYFFKVTEYGAKLESLDANKYNVYLNETDDEEPSIKTIYKKKHFEGTLEKMFGRCDSDEEIGKIITIPTNTIKIEYNVDIGE